MSLYLNIVDDSAEARAALRNAINGRNSVNEIQQAVREVNNDIGGYLKDAMLNLPEATIETLRGLVQEVTANQEQCQTLAARASFGCQKYDNLDAIPVDRFLTVSGPTSALVSFYEWSFFKNVCLRTFFPENVDKASIKMLGWTAAAQDSSYIFNRAWDALPRERATLGLYTNLDYAACEWTRNDFNNVNITPPVDIVAVEFIAIDKYPVNSVFGCPRSMFNEPIFRDLANRTITLRRDGAVIKDHPSSAQILCTRNATHCFVQGHFGVQQFEDFVKTIAMVRNGSPLRGG